MNRVIPDPDSWQHSSAFNPHEWCPVTVEWLLTTAQRPQENRIVAKAEVGILQEWAEAEHRDHRKELRDHRNLNQRPQEKWIDGFNRYFFTKSFLQPSTKRIGILSRLHKYKNPPKGGQRPGRIRQIFLREAHENEHSKVYLARIAYCEMHPLMQLMRANGFTPHSLALKLKKNRLYIWEKLEGNRCDTEIFLNTMKKLWPKNDWGKFLKDLYVWYATDYLEDPVQYVNEAMTKLDENFKKIRGKKAPK